MSKTLLDQSRRIGAHAKFRVPAKPRDRKRCRRSTKSVKGAAGFAFGALLLVSCGNATPSTEELNLEGKSLSRALAQVDDYDIALTPAPNCKFKILNGSESTYEVWTPTAGMPEDFVAAVRIETVREKEPGSLQYCGTIQLDLLPEVEADTQDLVVAQRLCLQAESYLSGSLTNLSPNDLKRGMLLPSLEAMQVNRRTPQFYDLQRFYFLAWNLVDYIDGLSWLEWVSQSSDEIADQRIASLDPLVRRNGNLTVIDNWRSALDQLESSQTNAALLCEQISSLVAQPETASSGGQSDGSIEFTQRSVVLPDMRIHYLTVSPDGEWLLAASRDQVAIVSLPNLDILAVAPVKLPDIDFDISAVAIDESSSFGVISVANYDSSLLFRVDPRTASLSAYRESPGQVRIMHFKKDGTGILGSCPVKRELNTCGIFTRDKVGRVEMVKKVQLPSPQSVFGGVAEDLKSDTFLIGAPNGMLYRVDITAGKAKKVRLGSQIWNKSKSVVQSPVSGETFVLIDRNDPSSGQKVELRKLTGSELGADLWTQLNKRDYPAQLTHTSIPERFAYISVSDPFRRWEWNERTRELHVVDIMRLSDEAKKIRVGSGTAVPPMVAHPSLPYIYVGTNSSGQALDKTNQITAIPISSS